MGIKYNGKLNSLSKSLRKNMTYEEKELWYKYLRHYPIKFYRQRIIENYIVDFYCSKARLIIELDGSQHYNEKAIEYDTKRTEFLENLGLLVIRIPNNEIKKNLPDVCDYIDSIVKERIN